MNIIGDSGTEENVGVGSKRRISLTSTKIVITPKEGKSIFLTI